MKYLPLLFIFYFFTQNGYCFYSGGVQIWDKIIFFPFSSSTMNTNYLIYSTKMIQNPIGQLCESPKIEIQPDEIMLLQTSRMHHNPHYPLLPKNEDKENVKTETHQPVPQESKTIPFSNKLESRKLSRKNVVRIFSKLQLNYHLEIESLILAVRLFDRCWGQIEGYSTKKIAIACFLLAIKYEERYPPSLNTIAHKMQDNISYKSYVTLEAKILQKFDYNIAMKYPTTMLAEKAKIFEHEKQNTLNVFLELVLFNEEIVLKNSWSTIVDAIIYLNSPYCERLKNETEEDKKVSELSKVLIIEYNRLTQHPFLYHKYYGQKK